MIIYDYIWPYDNIVFILYNIRELSYYIILYDEKSKNPHYSTMVLWHCGTIGNTELESPNGGSLVNSLGYR